VRKAAKGIRLNGHVLFPALGYEIMAARVLQNLDFWRVSIKINSASRTSLIATPHQLWFHGTERVR
jgi:hypothetical protein